MGAAGLIAATAPAFVLAGRLVRSDGHRPVPRPAFLPRLTAESLEMPGIMRQLEMHRAMGRYIGGLLSGQAAGCGIRRG